MVPGLAFSSAVVSLRAEEVGAGVEGALAGADLAGEPPARHPEPRSNNVSTMTTIPSLEDEYGVPCFDVVTQASYGDEPGPGIERSGRISLIY